MPGGAHPQATLEALAFPDHTGTPGIRPHPSTALVPALPTGSVSLPTTKETALYSRGLLSEPVSFHLFRCQPTSSRKPFWDREQQPRSVMQVPA